MVLGLIAPLTVSLQKSCSTQLKLLFFISMILLLATIPFSTNSESDFIFSQFENVKTKKETLSKTPEREIRANPFIVSGFVFLESGANANIGVNITGHILESGEIQTTTTQEKVGGLIGYLISFGYSLDWNAGDTLVLNATDYSPSLGSYHGTETVTIPEDAIELIVNITVFWDSKPTISSPLTINTTKVFENDSVSFEIGVYDDKYITEVQILINNSEYNMNLKTGNLVSGTWEYIYRFSISGAYLISALIFDSLQIKSSNQITLKVHKDSAPLLVLSANNTQPALNECVRFSIRVYEDRFLKNITLYIGTETMIPVLDSGDALNGTYIHDWTFNSSGIFYCYVVAYDLLTWAESNQITIASNTTVVPPEVLNVEANTTILEVNEAVQFSAEVSDNKNVVNVFLVSNVHNFSMILVIGNVTEGTWRYNWTTILPGIYYFRVYAVDNDGILSGNSSHIIIEVLPPDQLAEILGITPSDQLIIVKKDTEVEFSIWLRDDRGISLVYLYVEDLPLRLNYYSGGITNGSWTIKRYFDIIGQFDIYFEIWDSGNQNITSNLQTIIVDDKPHLFTLQTNVTSVTQLQGVYFQIIAIDDFNVTLVNLFINEQKFSLDKVSGNTTYSLWGKSVALQEDGIVLAYAIAYDNNSQSTNSEQISLTVFPDKRPELGVLRSSGNRIETNQEVVFTITAYDDIKVQDVHIFIEGQTYSMNEIQGNNTVSTWTYRIKFVEPGEYVITASAHDNLSQASDQSNTIILFVSPAELTSSQTQTTTNTQSKNSPIGFEVILTVGIVLFYIKKKQGGES